MSRRRPRSTPLTSRRSGASDTFTARPLPAPHRYTYEDFALDMRPVEDRRTYYPERARPARTLTGARHRLRAPGITPTGPLRHLIGPTGAFSGQVVSGDPRPLDVPSSVRFEAPDGVILCRRRSARRQVLHALGVAGRRGLAAPRRNEFSSVSCKKG